jgi:antitoxin component YwqK of YwqJK toxin-antitoxin module
LSKLQAIPQKMKVFQNCNFFDTAPLLMLVTCILCIGLAQAQELVAVQIFYPKEEGGKLKADFFINNHRDSLKHGDYKAYYRSGKLSLTGSYQNGERHGTFKEYYQNAKLKQETNYINGKREGASLGFDSLGNIIQRAFYRGDVLQDSLITYYSNGVVKSAAFFVDGKPEGLTIENYPNGVRKKEILNKAGVPNGLTREYFESGILAIEAEYINGYLNGIYKLYHPNGKLDTQSYMVNGAKDGFFKSYNIDGGLIMEGQYKAGYNHGPHKSYYDDGTIRAVVDYERGKKTGTAEYFDTKGRIKERIKWQNDEKKWVKGYFENGALAYEKNYLNTKTPYGPWIYYYANGKKRKQEEYGDDGKLTGTQILWDSTGTKIEVASFAFGLRSGTRSFYHASNGKLASQTEYKSDMRNGKHSEFTLEGKLYCEGAFKNDKETGRWVYYDEFKSPVKYVTYRNGKIVSVREVKFKGKK